MTTRILACIMLAALLFSPLLPAAPAAAQATQIVSHPSGCPHRAFCGCGTALRLLGRPVAAGGLAIAANWLGFPRAACAPGMAAARRGHVFAIEQCLPGNRALAYDPNSGGRKTRIHVRSLAGYHIVNPHGAYAQVNGKPGRSYRSHRYTRYAKRHHRVRYAHHRAAPSARPVQHASAHAPG